MPYRRLIFGFVAVVVIAMLLVVGSGLFAPAAPPSKAIAAKLLIDRKVFAADETPTLHLQLKNRSTAMTRLLHMRAYAASEPTVQVEYQDRKIDTTANITPEADGYTIVIKPVQQMRPGAYQVTVSGTAGTDRFDATQTFSWGVLAINTTQATYAPGEQAVIQMGALSAEGHTLCNAPITLSVVDPAGVEKSVPYTKSGDCKGDTFAVTPDYQATYVTTIPGTYTMRMHINDTKYTVSDTFQVAANQPFVISRSGPTRVQPSSPYGMGIHIKAQQNFRGVVRETLPDSRFKVLESPGGSVDTSSPNQVIISYKVDWQAGHEYNLAYQFKVPPVSPAFYYVGPLTLTDTAGQQVHKEARAWQIAGDAAITFVKETVITPGGVNSSTDSITSTAGNTLILLFGLFSTSMARCLGAVSDSAGNTWVVPAANPSTNPPQNGTTAIVSVNAMAYAANTAAISSITVTQCGTATANMAYNVEEFSGIASGNPVYDSNSGNNGSTLTTSWTTGTSTLKLCDQPTPDQLMRAGQYFCTDTSVLVIGIIFGGTQANNPTLSSGYTALTQVLPDNTKTTVRAFPAYKITSTSGDESFTYTVQNDNPYAWCQMVFRVQPPSDPSQPFFWAK
jgi:hypothetical protein